MTTQLITSPAKRHPGASGARPTGRGPTMFDETQRSQVEQRMASRLGDAWEDRQARLASGAHRGSPIRARVGRALVGIGHAIAGPSDDSTTAGRPI